MECTHCHRTLRHDWNFCPDCGQSISEASVLLQDHSQEDYPREDSDDYPMDFDPALYDL